MRKRLRGLIAERLGAWLKQFFGQGLEVALEQMEGVDGEQQVALRVGAQAHIMRGVTWGTGEGAMAAGCRQVVAASTGCYGEPAWQRLRLLLSASKWAPPGEVAPLAA